MSTMPVFLVCVAYFTYLVSAASIGQTYEDVALFVAPSAERAYAYGSLHFDARSPYNYDIVRARKLLHAAAQRDPRHPYVYHQLARIYFLQGNFTKARAYADAQIRYHGNESPNAYYVRGLIKGFAGDYAAAAVDFREFLAHKPESWAATNDLAWVLLKQGKSGEALEAIDRVVSLWPDNSWLLNSRAAALAELGRYAEAYAAASAAQVAAEVLSPEDWSRANPGNDPLVAEEGLRAFRAAIRENIHSIALAAGKSFGDVK